MDRLSPPLLITLTKPSTAITSIFFSISMERTELSVEENNNLTRPPLDLAVEEDNDLGFSEVAYDINKQLDKLVSVLVGGNSLPPPSHEPPTDTEIGNLELLEILWKASGKIDVLMHMLGKR